MRVRLRPTRAGSVRRAFACIAVALTLVFAGWAPARGAAQQAPQPVPAASAPAATAAPSPQPSAAQTATARALFEEGVDLADQKRWSEAADRFERVLAIRWSSAAAFNLAAALVELGRLLDASELYRRVALDEAAVPEMRHEAQRAVDALQPRLGRLHVLIAGDASGAEIYVDGQPLPPAAWGVPVVVDPGTHTVLALRGGETVASESAIVGDGAPLEAEVLLDLPDPVAPSPAAVAAAYEGEGSAAQTGGPARGGSVTDAWWFWAGTGVLAASTVTIILVLALSGGGNSVAPVQGTLDPGVLSGRVEKVR